MNTNKEVNEVKSAIDATHCATTSQSRRAELYRYLETITSDPFKCKHMGYYFIKCNEDHYRLFGYHCIRKICNLWNSLGPQDKNELKKLAINLFKFNINNNNNNSSNITLLKEKISELIVTIATYNWPHEWTDLLPVLFQISSQNPLSLEILFIILKDLYFVCGDRQIIPERRKKKIKDELMKNNKQIIQIFSVTIQQCYQQIFTNEMQNNNNNNNIQIAQNILRRCLEAMPKYLNQFPLQTILIDSQVLIGLSKIIQSVAKTSNNIQVPLCYDEFYRHALLSNVYFFMRKFSELNSYNEHTSKQQHVILQIWQIEMETIKGLYIMTHSNNNNNSNMKVALERLDNLLECMIRKLKLFNNLLDKKTNNNLIDIIFGICEITMKSNDLRIRLRSMTLWSFILNEVNTLEMIGYVCNESSNKYKQNEKFVNIIIGIMKYVLNHFRVKFHDLKSFETEQEWQTSRNILKNKITYLLQQCFVLCPYKGMECIGQFTLNILNCEKDTINVNSIGHSTINNKRYIALDGLCDVYRIIFDNSIHYTTTKDKKNKNSKSDMINETLFDNNSPLINMLIQLYDIIFNWTMNTKDNSFDTQLMSRVYTLLSYLIPLYCRKHNYLQKTFEKLLNDFPNKLPLNPTGNDAYDIKCNAVAHKRKIAFSLLHIAKRIPHICVIFIEPIWKQVLQIIHSNFSINNINTPKQIVKQKGIHMASIMELSEGPVCHLYELLVCISNGLNDINKRKKVLSDLLKDVIDNFNSMQIQNVININNSAQFAKMIQFPMESDSENNQNIKFAYHIRTLLNILQSTLTASLLCKGQTGLKDLFHSANLDGIPKFYDKKKVYNGNNNSNNIPSWPLFCAVFPNVLKLNKLLTYMYTNEFKNKLNSNYHSIIKSLDVKSLYNLYGLKYDNFIRNPNKKPKEIIPLEKAVIWIQNVRDYVCRIMAVSSYFNKQFFEKENAMHLIIESVISYWNELPLSHLSIILKHFFMNFVQLCSPIYYENILDFLYKFLSQCFQKLNKCWQQYNNINNNNCPNSTNEFAIKNEVYHEFAMRDASQKLWMSIAMITINHKERGFILLHDDKVSKKFRQKHLKPMQKQQQNDNNTPNTNNINLKQDKLVILVLKNENLCKCLLKGIECSLNWRDNNCHVRISQVASKIISFIAKHKMQFLYPQCINIFKATLNALSRNVIGDTQTNAELNILCVTICQTIGPLSPNIIINVLKNVPNVHIDDTKNIINLITSQPGKHTNASYRQSIKAFTNKYVIGKQNILSKK